MRLIDADAFRDYVLNGKPIGKTICEYSESDILYMIKQQPTVSHDPNEPLTLEELRQMEGEPVWIDYIYPIPFKSCWAIFYEESEGKAFMQFNNGCNSMITKEYRKTWLAYRRRPEEAPHG